MQNTFSQSGNDSKWFLKKSFFKIGMWHSRPPPFMANAILNFHFDYLTPSLIANLFLHAFLSNILVMKKLFPPHAWSYIAEDVIMRNFHFKSISTNYRSRKWSLIVVCSLRVMTEMGSRLWEWEIT